MFFLRFYFAVAGRQPAAHFFRIVMKWTHSAAVRDVAAFINYVEAFGPGGVRAFRGVTHVVYAKGHGVFKALDEIVGDVQALLEIFWLGIAHVVFYVGLHLPLVGGMRFAHINGQEIGMRFVIFINLGDVANLAAKRRSGKAAEDEHQRFGAGTFTNVKAVAAIQRDEARVRRVVPHF